MEAMYHGKLPRHDLDGRELYRGPLKDLAGGFRFVLFGIKSRSRNWPLGIGIKVQVPRE